MYGTPACLLRSLWGLRHTPPPEVWIRTTPSGCTTMNQSISHQIPAGALEPVPRTGVRGNAPPQPQGRRGHDLSAPHPRSEHPLQPGGASEAGEPAAVHLHGEAQRPRARRRGEGEVRGAPCVGAVVFSCGKRLEASRSRLHRRQVLVAE